MTSLSTTLFSNGDITNELVIIKLDPDLLTGIRSNHFGLLS